MIDQTRLLFIHGLAGSSQGFKATLLRQHFPHMIIPDFRGEFPERMALLNQFIGGGAGWTLIGSSLGGLMATAFALQHPSQLNRLVLFAPALPWLSPLPARPIQISTRVYHGTLDTVVPLDRTREVANKVFADLTFLVVEDDHGLGKTVQALDWEAILLPD